MKSSLLSIYLICPYLLGLGTSACHAQVNPVISSIERPPLCESLREYTPQQAEAVGLDGLAQARSVLALDPNDCWRTAAFVVAYLGSDLDSAQLITAIGAFVAGHSRQLEELGVVKGAMQGWAWRVSRDLERSKQDLDRLVFFSSHTRVLNLGKAYKIENVVFTVRAAISALALTGDPRAKTRLDDLMSSNELEKDSGSLRAYRGIVENAMLLYADAFKRRAMTW